MSFNTISQNNQQQRLALGMSVSEEQRESQLLKVRIG